MAPVMKGGTERRLERLADEGEAPVSPRTMSGRKTENEETGIAERMLQSKSHQSCQEVNAERTSCDVRPVEVVGFSEMWVRIEAAAVEVRRKRFVACSESSLSSWSSVSCLCDIAVAGDARSSRILSPAHFCSSLLKNHASSGPYGRKKKPDSAITIVRKPSIQKRTCHGLQAVGSAGLAGNIEKTPYDRRPPTTPATAD